MKESMKILHLFSDWKWTGPAEPVLNLCGELGKRGHQVTLAYRRPPFEVSDSIEKRVREKGIRATDQFRLNHVLKVHNGFAIGDNLHDFIHLPRFIEEERFDIVNVHQTHGHVIGGLAAKRSSHEVVFIRTDHKREALGRSLGNRLLISKLTDGMLTFSERARREDAENFGIPIERVCRIAPALDLDRFNPQKGFKNMRAVFGIGPHDTIIGMVARFQKYRRTEVFLEAVKTIVREFPNIKVLLVGRSSQMEESVIQPMKRLGIEPWVVLGGYRTTDYIDILACMDIFVFLMAGSDGTARALREAIAMGKPAVVANRGIMPELVEDGISGLVVEDTHEALADATLQLLRRPKVRIAMGKAAWQKARNDFRLDKQAEEVEAFYERMLTVGKWNAGRG